MKDIHNCINCKWNNSTDRMRLCPICNSNYDMWTPNLTIELAK